MVCTMRRLNRKIERIKKILLGNGYPEIVIITQIAKKIAQFSTLKRFGPKKYPVYLGVPWIDKPSTNLEKEVKTAAENCYGYVSTRLVFTSSACFLWPARLFHLLLRKVLSYMNINATVTVGTYGEHLNDYRIAISNMFRNG